jgi:hypothetical protein
MTIVLRVFGHLGSYFKGTKFIIELPSGAVFGDLLDSIAERWGKTLPPYVWEAEANRFKPGVLLSDGQSDFLDETTPLSDWQEIYITLPMAGG